MELIKNFGLDPVFLVAQIVNFLVILFLLRKFLYKPILEMLKKRQDTIKEGLRNAEEANSRLEQVIEEEKEILRNAQTQAKKMLDDVKIQTTALSKKMSEEAKDKSEKLLLDAREQIEKDAKDAEKKLALNISRIALQFLQKSLQGLFTEEDQKAVIKRAIKKTKEQETYDKKADQTTCFRKL